LMPGVLIIEALVQVASLLTLRQADGRRERVWLAGRGSREVPPPGRARRLRAPRVALDDGGRRWFS